MLGELPLRSRKGAAVHAQVDSRRGVPFLIEGSENVVRTTMQRRHEH